MVEAVKSEKEWHSDYEFALLDPRNITVAAEANDKIFSNPKGVYGIEVTIPKLADRCAYNLDPQHTGSNADRCAIEDAVFIELPEPGMTMVTVRPDMDAFGAMAVINLRKNNEDIGLAIDRIIKIAEIDKFSNSGYPGPKPLPDLENMWPEGDSETAAITAAMIDFKASATERVKLMEKWLMTGEEPTKYREQVESERADMVRAIESGEIEYVGISSKDDGKIDLAVVRSTHRAATNVGYSIAPVVVAVNPEFKMGGGEPYLKYTICAYEQKNADIKAALVELNELEEGWGGSPTIGGSPQGVSSKLDLDKVVNIVSRHIK